MRGNCSSDVRGMYIWRVKIRPLGIRKATGALERAPVISSVTGVWKRFGESARYRRSLPGQPFPHKVELDSPRLDRCEPNNSIDSQKLFMGRSLYKQCGGLSIPRSEDNVAITTCFGL